MDMEKCIVTRNIASDKALLMKAYIFNDDAL